MQVKGCYPSFTAQFDALHEDLVMWEPYSHEAITSRYPVGSLCCGSTKPNPKEEQ